jgi:predicted small metal-binding protein
MSQQPGPTNDAIEAARRELQATLAFAREALDRRRAVPVHTPDERAELQRDALAGRLGEDMRRLAEHIENGDESWQEVFEGIAPHGDLFHGHLTRMSDEHAEDIRTAIEEDEDFDPLAADPELS